MPKIIEFLGYMPFECPEVCTVWYIPEDPIDRLKYYKLVNPAPQKATDVKGSTF